MMPTAPSTFRPPWVPKPAEQRQAADARRGSAHARGYDWQWSKAAKAFLLAHPLCVCCLAMGAVVVAELVDHIVPHKGDRALFWAQTNWQALCNWCHEHVKKPLELQWLKGSVSAIALNLSTGSPLWRPAPSR